MDVLTLPSGPIGTNAFLLLEPSRGEAVLIDAPHEVWPIVQKKLYESNCRLVALLITHGHWDHTGDAAIIQRNNVPLYAHLADKTLIEDPRVMSAFSIPGLRLEPARIDKPIDHGSSLELLDTRFEVRHVPGHCDGNVLFYLQTHEIAFVGDAIFQGSVGRTDFPGGSFEILNKSIRTQIYTLPNSTKLYPGHGPETSVGTERQFNPYVKG